MSWQFIASTLVNLNLKLIVPEQLQQISLILDSMLSDVNRIETTD